MAVVTEAPASARRRRASAGPDRVTVLLGSVAAFLAMLAILAGQFGHSSSSAKGAAAVVLRRVYETRVIETIPPGAAAPAGGTSVSQSMSSSGAVAAAAPVTRTS